MVKSKYEVIMAKLVLPIGISGSGKSYIYNRDYKDCVQVSPDLIREELTGDISNQSKNKEVFKLAFERVDEYLNNGQDVFFDATNVNKSQRKTFTDKYIGTDVEVVYVILPADIDLSWKRIRADIREKKNRADVPYFALVRQKENYDNTIKLGFDDENVQEVIYV
jgi:predicted kinase